MALITGSNVTFTGSDGDDWPGATDDSVWDYIAHKPGGVDSPKVYTNAGMSGSSNITFQ